MNALRLQMLDDCEARVGSGRLPVEEVVKAFITPVLRLGSADAFRRLIGRMYTEPGDFARRIICEHTSEVARRFTIAIRRALPDLADVDLHWGASFTIGFWLTR